MRNQLSILKQCIKIEALEKLLLPMRVLPVDDRKVLFLPWLGFKYAGNTRYAAEELERRNGGVKIYFAVKGDLSKLQTDHPSIHFIKFGTPDYFLHAMTSKVFVTDGGGVSYIPFKKSQSVIGLWHGGGAYKRVGIDALGDTKLTRFYNRNDSKKFNFYLSSCRSFTDMFVRTKLLDRDVFLEIGMPRNDILIHPDEKKTAEIKENLHLIGKKAVLYAPTFRDYSDNVYEWKMPDLELDTAVLLETLEEKFGGEWVFLYRGHPNTSDGTDICGEKIINVTAYPEMQELLLAADILITDYSSSIWDFALTGKPGFIFAPDLEMYRRYRGDFVTPIEKWPYELAVTNAQLFENIEKYSSEDAKMRICEHLKLLGNKETGEASKKLANIITDMCNGKTGQNV